MESGQLVDEADRAVARGDLQRAVALLNDAADRSPDDANLCMKIAALYRALADPDAALQMVHRALALSPLDFTMLLMRASLMERLGRSGAGEAWCQALAQKPDGAIPPQLTSVV